MTRRDQPGFTKAVDPSRDHGSHFAPAGDARAFVEKWADIIQGGDPLESLEGWAREFVIEARELLARAEGA